MFHPSSCCMSSTETLLPRGGPLFPHQCPCCNPRRFLFRQEQIQRQFGTAPGAAPAKKGAAPDSNVPRRLGDPPGGPALRGPNAPMRKLSEAAHGRPEVFAVLCICKRVSHTRSRTHAWYCC